MAPRVNNKKVKSDKGSDKDNKKVDKVEKTSDEPSDEGSNSGFGSYLKSEQGTKFFIHEKKKTLITFA